MKSKRQRLARHLLDGVMARDVNRVRELLKQGADVNSKDEEHAETPLLLAVKFAGVEMVRLLLEAGAEVDARDGWGRTALFYAQVSSEVFGVLLCAGADVQARDEEGNSILWWKVSESASRAEVEELLRLGLDPDARNGVGETALDVAESLGLIQVAERLRVRAG